MALFDIVLLIGIGLLAKLTQRYMNGLIMRALMGSMGYDPIGENC